MARPNTSVLTNTPPIDNTPDHTIPADTPRLRQDNYDLREDRKERSVWVSVALLLTTAAVLVYAAYVWYSSGNNHVNLTEQNQTTTNAQ